MTIQVDVQELEERVNEVTTEVVKIESDVQFRDAGQFLVKVKAAEKAVKEHFEPYRKKAYDDYQLVLTQIKEYTDRLAAAEKSVKRLMQTYQAEQDRMRLAAEAQRRRIEDARRREEEQRRLAAEQERIMAALESGDDSLLVQPEEPEIVPEPVAAPVEAPRVDGVAFVEHWDFEVVDMAKIPLDFMMPNDQKIRATVKALKEQAETLLGPGVRVFCEKRPRVTGR